jgi:hypothetical protein
MMGFTAMEGSVARHRRRWLAHVGAVAVLAFSCGRSQRAGAPADGTAGAGGGGGDAGRASAGAGRGGAAGKGGMAGTGGMAGVAGHLAAGNTGEAGAPATEGCAEDLEALDRACSADDDCAVATVPRCAYGGGRSALLGIAASELDTFAALARRCDFPTTPDDCPGEGGGIASPIAEDGLQPLPGVRDRSVRKLLHDLWPGALRQRRAPGLRRDRRAPADVHAERAARGRRE